MMQIKLHYMIFAFCLIFIGAGCSSDSKKEGDKEEASKDQTKEVEEVVGIFFSRLLSYEFDASKDLVTKASYSSISFLEKTSADIQSIDLDKIDSCSIDGKSATCFCEFGYPGGENVKKVIHLGKYGEEWLIDFQLGTNFDNIFTYNYGSKESKSWNDTLQLELDDQVKHELSTLIGNITSGKVKLGFSSMQDIASLDEAFDGYSSYASTVQNVNDFNFLTTYSFSDDRLESCYVDIDRISDYGEDRQGEAVNMNVFRSSMCQLVSSLLGKPFNISEEEAEIMHEMHELRWFIKGYNEILTMRLSGGYYSLMITEIP